VTLDEKIESVRLDFIKFWKGEEWLNALQAYRTYIDLKVMKDEIHSSEFPELRE